MSNRAPCAAEICYPSWADLFALALGASPNLNIGPAVRGLCPRISEAHLPGNHRATVREGTPQLVNAKYLVGDRRGAHRAPKELRERRLPIGASSTLCAEHVEEPANEEEKTIYQMLRNLFDDYFVNGVNNKLSPTVARLWGSMIDEVVVWGITKLMGESFKLHAQALTGYEDALLGEAEQKIPSPTAQLQRHKTEVTAF
ncbi:hypothetical protein LTR17_027399 [Elasticomyces elasticus]|nr:hypothetical protein LTR17_027399 [Elasticomyces elasticus]